VRKNLLHTQLCDMLGIEYPIIAAGMGYVSGPALAAAVSNAGGMGVLGAASFTPEELRELIRRTRGLTDKPFGVDAPILQFEDVDPNATEKSLRAQMPPEAVAFAQRFGEVSGIPKVRGRAGLQAFSIEVTKQWFKVALEEHVPVFVSGAGDPSWMVPEAHAGGMKMMACIGLVRHARRVAGSGVDIIIAQGGEAGGHTGRIGTMPLVPLVVDAISPTPVLAAGGIADGRGLVASLALGAVGVWLGTVFVPTEEACLEAVEFGQLSQWEVDLWKRRIIESTEDGTITTRVFDGKTLRMIKNRFEETWVKMAGPVLKTPRQNVLLADLIEGVRQAKMEEYTLPVGGQISGMITQIRPAGEIVRQIVEEATDVLQRLGAHGR
jgi:nitronate monooxygenase